MVAGDHHWPDAGGAAAFDGHFRLFAGRVDHANEPYEHEIPFDTIGSGVERLRVRHGSPGKRQHPQRPAGEACGGRDDLAAALLGERHHLARLLLRRAAGEHRLGGALRGEQPAAIRHRHDHAHPLAVGIEGNLEQRGD